jgi:hypothetical protein
MQKREENDISIFDQSQEKKKKKQVKDRKG